MSGDTSDSAEEAEWLTVAEAAHRMDIAPRQARRYAAKLRPDQRQEDPPPLRVLFSAILETKDKGRDSVPPHEDTPRDRDRDSVPGMALSVVREGFFDQIVAAQAALLKEKDERIADLQSALDHAREQELRLTEALAREQALRALDAPPKAVESPETGGGAAVDSQTGPETPTEAPTGGIRAFWQRLTGRSGGA